MNKNETHARALRATLAELGATPAKAREMVEAGRASRDGADTPGAIAAVKALVEASDILGKTAHRVLGHVPDADAYHTPAENAPEAAAPAEHAPAANPPPAPEAAAPPVPEADTLLARLTFLREHIVSTIDQQGAEVWRRLAEDGRPLQAYAEDLARTDAALLLRLREMTRA